MTAATTRQSPSQSQSASPPQPNNSQSSIQVQETSTLDDNQAQNYYETNSEQHQIIGAEEMATNVKPQQTGVTLSQALTSAPQQLPPSTSTYFLSGNGLQNSPANFSFPQFMAPHLIHQQKMSPAFQPIQANFAPSPAAFIQPQQQPQQYTKAAESPKRDSSILNSMCNRSQRCGVCKGCTNSACGRCNFCADSPQFGGPGVKKQSCLERRCHRVLENKLQRDSPSFRARRGCGTCEDCRVPNCNACLVCFDRRYFENRYIPGAMCARKRCNHAVLLDNSTRMRPVMKKRQSEDNGYSQGNNKPPAKRPSPSEHELPTRIIQQQQMTVQTQQGNGSLTQRLLQQPALTAQPLLIQQQQATNRLPNENRPAQFHPYPSGVQLDFPTQTGFQPPTLQQQDPNATNRLYHPSMGANQVGPNGMCLFPSANTNGLFLPASNVQQQNFYFIPQPLQPTAIQNSIGKEIKDDSSGSSPHTNEDPYQPPSYNQESNGSVVLQAL